MINTLALAVYMAINNNVRSYDKSYNKYQVVFDTENKTILKFTGIDKEGNPTDLLDLYLSNFELEKSRFDEVISHLKKRKIEYGKFLMLEVTKKDCFIYTKVNDMPLKYKL
jgi:hypothetical protein